MKKNTEVKKLIISTTKELLRKNSNITIKDIAEACFINIAAVNYHFGSKDNLIAIVLKEIIEELKDNIYIGLKSLNFEEGIEGSLEKMIQIVFKFTLENSGVIKYMFIHNDNLDYSSNLLMDAFFTENEFTKMIINEINKAGKIEDATVSKAKYMLLFSCFSIPIFLQVTDFIENKKFFSSFSDPSFLQTYIREMLRIINWLF